MKRRVGLAICFFLLCAAGGLHASNVQETPKNSENSQIQDTESKKDFTNTKQKESREIITAKEVSRRKLILTIIASLIVLVAIFFNFSNDIKRHEKMYISTCKKLGKILY